MDGKRHFYFHSYIRHPNSIKDLKKSAHVCEFKCIGNANSSIFNLSFEFCHVWDENRMLSTPKKNTWKMYCTHYLWLPKVVFSFYRTKDQRPYVYARKTIYTFMAFIYIYMFCLRVRFPVRGGGGGPIGQCGFSS